ncbi:MAG: ABC transporter permease [Terracidiphilus sp.]
MRWWQLKKRDADLERELRSDLELEEEEQREKGLSGEDAQYAARRAFGNPTLIREQTHEAWGWAWFERWVQDARYALRQMRKSPGFAAVVVLVLALAIGANATVFSVLNAVLLRPLDFPNADRLVQITSMKNGKPVGVSGPDWRDFATQNQSLDKTAIYDQWRKNVSTSQRGDDPAEVLVGLASPQFFEALGIQPLLGRLFTEDEGLAGRNHVALITEGFWKAHYQRNPTILGHTLTINDQPYTIIGILPDTIPGWLHGAQAQLPVFEPFLPEPGVWSESARAGRGDGALGLLKPGATVDKAQADLARIAGNLASTHPVDRGVAISVVPLEKMRTGDLRPLLLLLMGAVALILLIACSNLAALLLARNTARQREFAMRKALGAGRAALIRQIFTEILVLSALGSGLGLLLAWGAIRAMRMSDPGMIPQLLALTLDWRVVLFTLAAGLGTCLLFGTAPAMLSARVDAAEALKQGGRTSSGVSQQWFRRMLVTGQIGLSLMLLVAAALVLQTLERLEKQDLGFRVDHLMRGHLYLPPVRYATPDAITRFCDELTERIRVLPGVREVSVTTVYPPRDGWHMMFSIEGRPVSRLEEVPSTIFGVVDANYLRTAGIPLIEGREFSQSDREGTLPAAIVNQAFVKQYFSRVDPIGQRIELGAPASLIAEDTWMGAQRETVTIVGVMRDNHNQGLTLPVAPQLITLFRQTPKVNFGFKDLLVRSDVAPETLEQAVAQQIHALDSQLPLSEVETMNQYIGDITAVNRFTSMVLTGFAVVGILLAVTGIYGVIAFLVAQRTHEIGIRLALGAPRSAVVWLVSLQGLWMALSGVTVGLVGSVVTSRSLASLLYGVSALDPFTLLAASTGLVAIALAACALPARRAANIDPLRALRAE